MYSTASSGLAATCGYLLGMVPSADIAAKLAARLEGKDHSIDLRDAGTGNPGATNAGHVLGTKWGAGVLVVDIAKGALASLAGRRFAGSAGATIGATASVVGHCYPAWNRAGGGKGVAPSIGQVLGTFPVYFPLDFAVAAATVAVPTFKEKAFVANSVASVVWVASSTLWWKKGWSTGWDPTAPAALPIGAAVSSAVIASKFLSNPIRRDDSRHESDA